MPAFKISVEDAIAKLEKSEKKFVQLMQHASMKVEYYAPSIVDPQTPHLQDELYVIISGNGNFIRDEETIQFKPNDVLFVPAGMQHRFENFSEDFATWVIFYGVDGGEK